MSALIEHEQEQESVEGMPPSVGHHSGDPAQRVALCGAPILGILAFGKYVRCAVCVELYTQKKNELWPSWYVLTREDVELVLRAAHEDSILGRGERPL